MMHRSSKLIVLAGLCGMVAMSAGERADAARAPEYLKERPLEVAGGDAARTRPSTSWNRAPAAAAAAWQKWQHEAPGWQAQWDRETAVPTRMWGRGIAVVGAVASPALAERAARQLLAAHLDLLAPGAAANDFVLVSNVVHAKGTMRTVGFAQTHDGVPVIGGQLGFLFKADRLMVISSQALPNVSVPPVKRQVRAEVGDAKAKGWITAIYGGQPTIGRRGKPAILPIVTSHGTAYRTVLPVEVASTAPRGLWEVFVDVESGEPVARRQKLRFAEANLRYRVPTRHPGGTLAEAPAPLVSLTVGGAQAMTTLLGVFGWEGPDPAQITTTVTGQFIQVFTVAGATATETFTVNDGGSVIWDRSTDEIADAQLNAFVHANRAREYALGLAPDLDFLNTPLQVYVNEDDVCNAYSTGDDIHFFLLGVVDNVTCQNTGRIADVVYHEFGHSLHAHAIIEGAGDFDSSLSEGVSDYLAATITGDPAMGRGFFMSDEPLRHIDPVGTEKQWPEDAPGEPHEDGEIIAGALWDLRKALIDRLGEAQGIARADQFYYALLQRASDIPSTYVEALAFDDDDGDLTNGTPNECAILHAFGTHGLAGPEALGIAAPILEGKSVSVPLIQGNSACPPPAISTAILDWRMRADQTVRGEVTLEPIDGKYQGTFPAQVQGAIGQVVQYRVSVSFADGTSTVFPKNPADGFYETFIGEVTPLYCTDFESDPTDWSHGALEGRDRWQIGAVTGGGTDATAPYSGARILGTRLDGDYGAGSNSYARSPEIDVTGHGTVRLQYRRWLSVEDGAFDQATIKADGVALWGNMSSGSNFSAGTHHQDGEWRFHDVDLSSQVADGKVTVSFELTSDEGLQFGGWNIDDVCIVAAPAAGPVCGDTSVTGTESCDDGNLADGDGCSAACQLEDEPSGCCSAGGNLPASGFLVGLLALVLRRRRRG